MSPMLPSWMRSRNWRPRFMYFFAIDTTRRRLAWTISCLAARVADLLRQRDERLARHPELAACVLQRGPLVRRELTALRSVREAVRQAEQLGRQAAGALLDRLEAAPERRGPLEGSVEPARHLLGLPAREPEPAERGEEARLEARAILGEPGAPAASMG